MGEVPVGSSPMPLVRIEIANVVGWRLDSLETVDVAGTARVDAHDEWSWLCIVLPSPRWREVGTSAGKLSDESDPRTVLESAAVALAEGPRPKSVEACALVPAGEVEPLKDPEGSTVRTSAFEVASAVDTQVKELACSAVWVNVPLMKSPLQLEVPSMASFELNPVDRDDAVGVV